MDQGWETCPAGSEERKEYDSKRGCCNIGGVSWRGHHFIMVPTDRTCTSLPRRSHHYINHNSER